MAVRNVYVDLSLNKQALLAAKLNPLSTANRTALALVAGDAGYTVWDTDLSTLYVWSGTAWVAAVPGSAGPTSFKGGLAASATAPTTPANGDTYVFTSAGTLGASWVPVALVEVGDEAVWDSAGAVWRYLQANVVAASTSVAGTVALATQAEANTGTDAQKAITPSTLAGVVPSSALAARLVRRVVVPLASLVAGTPATVTHGLNLADPNDLTVECWQGGNKIGLAVASSTTNTISVASNVSLSTVRVVCEG